MKRTFKQLKVDLGKVIQKLNEPIYKERVAKRALEIIYRRVKSGYGASGSDILGASDKQKLKPLSESYILYRQGKIQFFRNRKTGKVFALTGDLKEFKNRKGQTEFKVDSKGNFIRNNFDKPQLGAFASPKKSNLTLSGQLLESMTFKIGKEIILYIPSTTRKKLKPSEKATTNKKVAEYVEKERPFFAITKPEYRILEREIDLIIKEILKSLQL